MMWCSPIGNGRKKNSDHRQQMQTLEGQRKWQNTFEANGKRETQTGRGRTKASRESKVTLQLFVRSTNSQQVILRLFDSHTYIVRASTFTFDNRPATALVSVTTERALGRRKEHTLHARDAIVTANSPTPLTSYGSAKELKFSRQSERLEIASIQPPKLRSSRPWFSSGEETTERARKDAD